MGLGLAAADWPAGAGGRGPTTMATAETETQTNQSVVSTDLRPPRVTLRPQVEEGRLPHAVTWCRIRRGGVGSRLRRLAVLKDGIDEGGGGEGRVYRCDPALQNRTHLHIRTGRLLFDVD